MLAALPENRLRSKAEADELFHPAECLAVTTAKLPGGQALRLRVPATDVAFEDRSLGTRRYDVAGTVGDFVLQRRDGLHAYQLAVVVDDAAQGISDVVRGCDLLASSARQVLLQQALGYATPRYLHLPLAVDDRGLKLSKSDHAPAAGHRVPAAQLVAVLRFLGQAPPDGLERATLAEAWDWGRAHWRVAGFAGRERGTVTWLGGNAGDAG
jgi:glutamyl-Q tRNA(Asp) synthetase